MEQRQPSGSGCAQETVTSPQTKSDCDARDRLVLGELPKQEVFVLLLHNHGAVDVKMQFAYVQRMSSTFMKGRKINGCTSSAAERKVTAALKK